MCVFTTILSLDRKSLAAEKAPSIDYQEGCGKCLQKCGQDALYIQDNKAKVIEEKCLLCGYCASACPNFAIKIC